MSKTPLKVPRRRRPRAFSKLSLQRLDLTFCTTFRVRGWGGTGDLLLKSFAGWKKTYKRECYLGETSVSLRLAQVLEPPWKFSPGQYAPKPGVLLGGGWPEEGRGGRGWCQHLEEEEAKKTEIIIWYQLGWGASQGLEKIMTRGRRLVPTSGGGGRGWWTTKWTTKEERHYEDCGTQQVSHVSKSNASC